MLIIRTSITVLALAHPWLRLPMATRTCNATAARSLAVAGVLSSTGRSCDGSLTLLQQLYLSFWFWTSGKTYSKALTKVWTHMLLKG